MTATPARLKAMARQIDAACESGEREVLDRPFARAYTLLGLARRLSAAEWELLAEMLEIEGED